MLTVTDLFCGAGGSSLGMAAAGLSIEIAANHWQTAVEVHQSHFPETRHDLADISQADPRRYPVTDVLWASPECTNHSQARGVSRKEQDPTLWDAPDPAAERSRATMWDVPRFAERNPYAAIIVENVVEVAKWVGYRAWCIAMEDLGYDRTVLSINSMHHQVAQSRDRAYIVLARKGIKPDFKQRTTAWCARCDTTTEVHQAWKNNRTIGRYRTQWTWQCSICGDLAEPRVDTSLNDHRLGSPMPSNRRQKETTRQKNTRNRILSGLRRHGWQPILTAGAGNTDERTPGNRSRPTSEPLPTQTPTAQTALGLPPAFLVQTAHGGRLAALDSPHPTVCASDDRHSLVVGFRGTSDHAIENSTRCTRKTLAAVTAGGIHHGIIVANNTNNVPRSTNQPVSTVTIGNRHALLMRNQNSRGNQGAMLTPVTEPARTMVASAVNQSLVDPADLVDDCGFRMLTPYEVTAAMAFPTGYIRTGLTKRDQVKLAGNAVTPPVAQAIMAPVINALDKSS